MSDRLFKALADPTRRQVLRLLRHGDLTAGEIAERFPRAASTMSGHLKLLRQAGLLVTERHGTCIVYSLNLGVHEELLATALELMRLSERHRRHEDEAVLADGAPAAGRAGGHVLPGGPAVESRA